jgi:hypothetical protein
MCFLDEPTAAIVGYTKGFQTTGFCDLKMETVCFSKTLLIKQITGCHIYTIILENDITLSCFRLCIGNCFCSVGPHVSKAILSL